MSINTTQLQFINQKILFFMAEQQIITILNSLTGYIKNNQYDQALNHYDAEVEVDATAWGAPQSVIQAREKIMDGMKATSTVFDQINFEITGHKVVVNGNSAQADSNVSGRYKQGDKEYSFQGINHTTWALKNNAWVITKTKTQINSETGDKNFVLAATFAALQKK